MGHYVINFDYRFNNNPEGGRISELFFAYTAEDLARLELKGKLGKAIEELQLRGGEELYPFDEVFEGVLEYNRMPECIKYVEEDFAEFSLADEREVHPAFRTSLWDMLSDARLVKYAADRFPEYAEQLGKDREPGEAGEAVNRLAEITVYSQLELCVFKIKASILAHLECALSREISVLREERVNVRRVRRDIEFYERVKKALKSRNLPDLPPAGEVPESPYHVRVNGIEEEIRGLVVLNGDRNTKPEQVRANWIAMRVLNRELEVAIRAPFERACELYEVIRGVRERKKVQRIWRTIPRLQLLLDERQDTSDGTVEYMVDKGPTSTIDCIVADAGSFAGHAGAAIGNSYAGRVDFSGLNSYVGGDGTRFIKGKYSGDNKGCFALLITKGDKHYFSFSGMAEELKLPGGCLQKPIRTIMEDILNLCPAPDILVHNYKYNYAYITHNLEVRRYTDILHNPPDYLGQIGPYIDPPENYKDDYAKDPSVDYGDTYSCCERKMMAYSGYDNVRYIFSRWAPCWKCCPAIVDAKGARVFAFTTLQQFNATGKYDECKIHEYVVGCDRAYTVETK